MAEPINVSEWWAVLTNGEWFCGKRPGDKRLLTHLLKLQLPFTPEPNEKGLLRPKTSVMLYPWIVDELNIPEGAIWLSVAAIHQPEQWCLLIENANKLKIEARAQRAGIHLA